MEEQIKSVCKYIFILSSFSSRKMTSGFMKIANYGFGNSYDKFRSKGGGSKQKTSGSGSNTQEFDKEKNENLTEFIDISGQSNDINKANSGDFNRPNPDYPEIQNIRSEKNKIEEEKNIEISNEESIELYSKSYFRFRPERRF